MIQSVCTIKINGQGKELIEHGTPLFPVDCCYDDLTVASVPWHWHDELEALVVSEGTAVVAAEARQFTLKQGDGCFINSGVLHGAWAADFSACRFHSVVFHPRLVGAGVDSVFWLRYVQPLMENRAISMSLFDGSAPWHGEANRAIEAAWQSLTREPEGYEFQVRQALSQLVFLLSAASPPTDAVPSERALRNDRRIKQMLQYIHEHYGENLTAADIAQAASVSESECLRCFRHAINASPSQYLKQFRVQKAAELLKSSSLPTADIGSLCGFQDASYFAKTFRNLTGQTPSAYRKRFS